MSAQALVVYTLSSAGDLKSALPQLSAGLKDLRDKAVAATAETKRMIAGSATASRAALNGVAEESKQAAEGIGKALGMLALAGYGIHKVLDANKEWHTSTKFLTATFRDLGKEIANAIGPTAARWLDNFTIGFVYLKGLVVYSLIPAFKSVATTINDLFDMSATGLDAWKALFSGNRAGFVQAVADQRIQFATMLTDIDAAVADVTAGQAKALEDARKKWQQIESGIVPDDGTDKSKDPNYAKVAGKSALNSFRYSFDPAVAKSFGALTTALEDVRDAFRGTAYQLVELPQKFEQAFRYAAAQNTANSINNVGSALSSGTASGVAAAAGGPYGAIIAAIIELLRNIDTTLMSAFEDGATLLDEIPGKLATVMREQIPEMIKAQPDMIADMLSMVPEIIVNVIAALPSVVQAIFEQFAQLIPAIIKGFVEAFTGIFKGKDGESIFATHLGKDYAGKRKFLGIHLGKDNMTPSFDDGGVVTRTGMAMVHAGETFSGVSSSRTVNQTHNNQVSMINNIYASDPVKLAEQLRYMQGSYGLGLRLNPLVT